MKSMQIGGRAVLSRVAVGLLAVASLAACSTPGGSQPAITATPAPLPATPPAGKSGWWNNDVFYEVFVRSFADGNGDGTGDLKGLIQKLDYLNDGYANTAADLGITGIWLMPVMQSPSYHGYDVTDYYGVESDYGANQDFQALVQEAHKRGIKVIVDLVLNHTSIEHPWFVDSAGGSSAAHRDWYVWSANDPGIKGPDGQQVWYGLNGSFYYALFWSRMPDLNYRNPQVTAEMESVTRYWVEKMGVDGFRLDAVRHLIEEGPQQSDTPSTHAWLAGYQSFTDSLHPDPMTVGEVWGDTQQIFPYIANHELDLAFEFPLAASIPQSVNAGDPSTFAARMKTVQAAYPAGQFATFLTNHDQDRVMSQLGNSPDKARLAATLLLTLPGVPFIYYGEEIGMTGAKPDEMIRTPMQWSAGPNAGFSTNYPWEKVNSDYEKVNVETEAADPSSLLSRYRELIQLRNVHPALQQGDLLPVESSCGPVYGFLRTIGGEQPESVLVLANFSDQEQKGCGFSVSGSKVIPGTYQVKDLLHGSAGAGSLTLNRNGGLKDFSPLPSLAPREGYVLLLDP